MEKNKPQRGRPRKSGLDTESDNVLKEKKELTALAKAVKRVGNHKLWEQKNNEPKLAFDLFEHFLNSSSRSVANTAIAFNLDPEYVLKFYEENQWEARALSYDKHILNKEIGVEIIEPEKLTNPLMRERHLKIANLAENYAAMGLYLWNAYLADSKVCKEKGLEIPEPPLATMDQIIRAADFGTRLARLTMEMPSTITENRKQLDYSKLSVDELQQLRQLASKTKKDD